MIRIRSLEFSYTGTEFRLSIPEFSIAVGEKVAVIGPSGSGKTTLLNLVAGILQPDKGSIRVDDCQVDRMGDAARRNFRINRIGFIFQGFELVEYLDVLDNILHPYRITRSLKLDRRIRDRACSLAGQMGIGNRLGRPVNRLSQGEQQRVAICRALLPEPSLILADEATGNLDPHNKAHILDLLFAAVDDSDTTLLAVTHDHELLPRFDRIVDFNTFLGEGAG